MMKAQLFSVFAVASLLSLAACGGPSYAHTDIDQVSTSSALAGQSVNVQQVTILEGGLATAHIVSYNTDNKGMGNSVESDNPAVLEVSSTTSDHVYAFLGISAGNAHVTIRADGDAVVTIVATVQPQHAQ
jgi:hypothetical protein